MAFQASALPSVAAATTDLWPSIANTLMVPWRGTTAPPPSRHASARRPLDQRDVKSSKPEPAIAASKTELPEFLAGAELPQTFLPTFTPASPLSIQKSIADMTPSSLIAANPLLRPSFGRGASPRAGPRTLKDRMRLAGVAGASRLSASRGFSTEDGSRSSAVSRFVSSLAQPVVLRSANGALGRRSLLQLQPFAAIPVLRQQQLRGFGTAGISRNLLENREAAANRNPSSATAQNAFYQVLLKANMPHIVVERYQSGRFATNEGATEAYHRALGMISASPSAATGDLAGQTGSGITANNTQLTPSQLQAVGQAIAAQTRGGHVAVTKGGVQGTGAKDAPIHVVVDQPISESLFRWVKFVMWFCLFTYLSLVVVTMMIEGLNTIKRPTGRADNEVKAENQKTRFTDVHGCEEAKEELQELVEFLKNPSGFSTLGGKLPKGILLVGPPGTGKTLLARAVAGEAGVPFFYMSGSEFDEVYVGVGAKRVRELFASARAKAPAIVFIDELDAVGSKRNTRDAAYVKQTLNQLLTELDGFEQNSGVIILAATNFPEMLDKALTRPGRFDRMVHVDLPDVRGRLAILKHHAKKIKAAPDIDLESIALLTSGLSGAELESIVNQAAIHASKSRSLSVGKKDFEWAKDKVIMGAERKSMVITPKEKELTAYHEAGHALVSYFTEGPRKLYKVTVLPRGGSLGHTSVLPEMDKYSYSVKDLLSMIDVSLGGKLAEEIVYGNDMVTGGASSDLENATSVAYRMVAQLGMSEKLGPVEWGNRYDQLSSQTKALIEEEVQKTLSLAYERARKLLLSKRKELDLLAKALVQYETLDKDEVVKVISGQKLTDRVPVPEGPMLVPKASGPFEQPLPGLAGPTEEDSDGKTPPPPPATVP